MFESGCYENFFASRGGNLLATKTGSIVLSQHVHNQWDIDATQANRQAAKQAGKKGNSEQGSSIQAHTFKNMLWKNKSSFAKSINIEELKNEGGIGYIIMVERKNATERWV